MSRLLGIAVPVVLVAAGCRRTVVDQPTPTAVATPSAQPVPTAVAVLTEADPFDVIHRARIENGATINASSEPLPKDAVSHVPLEKKAPGDEAAEHPTPKIHPVLERWLTEQSPDTRVPIIVSLVDIAMPRFPDVPAGESRDSAAYKAAAAASAKIVRDITARRANGYDTFGAELKASYGAEVIDTFWLVQAMQVVMPLGRVRALADRPDVRYVQPVEAGEPPPQDGDSTNDVDDARAVLVSDPYFDLNQTAGWIGLLDTGLRSTHTLFNNPGHVDFRRDCVNGGAGCNTGTALNPNDDCWNHGTSSGAIIAGNGNLGNAYRGATAITLDSWKVYPTTTDANGACTGGLDAAAAVRGFEAAVAAIDRVIVAEMQGVEDETGVISSAADKAFEAGAVVIAANGNFGPGDGSVRAPAKAHMVIGVGDFNVASGAQIGSQGRGPTADGRYKPDIQAPTESETASNASDTALRVFNGTSGATPYAGAVAALLRNWLRGGTGSIDPGQVYAHLILIGQTPWPFNNTSGAGKLRMPTNGLSWWGKVKVADGATIDIPITVADAGGAGVDAALWWPEMATQQHNDVDVALVRPDGTEAASSLSTVSVFERARASGAVPAGLWHVSVRGFHVPVGPQTVYWAARWAR